MPAYITRPATTNTPVQMLIAGQPAYAFGSKNTSRPTVKMSVTSVAVSSNVATLGVTMMEGYIPAVGDLITVVNTTTDSGGANVTNVALASVTITALTGKGTVTYAATASDQLTTADTGMAYVAVPETPEALTNISSRAFAIQETSGSNENGLTITWSTYYPTAPSTVTMTLQAAMVDQDSQYQTLDTSTSTSEDLRLITLTRFRFIRVTASNVTGTNPTAIVRFDI